MITITPCDRQYRTLCIRKIDTDNVPATKSHAPAHPHDGKVIEKVTVHSRRKLKREIERLSNENEEIDWVSL